MHSFLEFLSGLIRIKYMAIFLDLELIPHKSYHVPLSAVRVSRGAVTPPMTGRNHQLLGFPPQMEINLTLSNGKVLRQYRCSLKPVAAGSIELLRIPPSRCRCSPRRWWEILFRASASRHLPSRKQKKSVPLHETWSLNLQRPPNMPMWKY